MNRQGFVWMDPAAGRPPSRRRSGGRATVSRSADRLERELSRLRRRVTELERELVAGRLELEAARRAATPVRPELPEWAARVGLGVALGVSGLAALAETLGRASARRAARWLGSGHALGRRLRAPWAAHTG